jgi:hypothetical protein
MLVGSRLFIGVDEYIKEISRILKNLFKNADGDPNILAQNKFVWVSNFNAVINFIRDHLVKHDILDLAVKEFEDTGELSQEAESALDSVNVKWLGLEEAKNLLNQIKKDLIQLANRQTFLINTINETLGGVLTEEERPVGIEIAPEKFEQLEAEAPTAVAIDEKEKEEEEEEQEGITETSPQVSPAGEVSEEITESTSQAAGRQQQLETQPTEEVPAGIEATQEAPLPTEIPGEFAEFGMENVPEGIQEYTNEGVDDILWNQMNSQNQQAIIEEQQQQEAAEQQDLIKPLEDVLSEALDRAENFEETQEDKELIFQDLLNNPKKLKQFLKPYKELLKINADWNQPTTLKRYNNRKTPKSLQQYIWEKGGIFDEGGEFANYPRLRRLKPGTIKGDTVVNDFDHWVEHLKQTSYWQQDIADQAKDDLEALQLHLQRTYGEGAFQQFADNGGLYTIYPAEFVNAASGKYINDIRAQQDLDEVLDFADALNVSDPILARAIYFNIPIVEAARQLGRLTPDQQSEQNKLDQQRKEADRKQARKQRQGAFDFTPALGQAGQEKVRKTLPSRFEEDTESISVINQFVEFYTGKKGLLSNLGLEVLYSLEVLTEEDISKGMGLQQFASLDRNNAPLADEVFVLNLIQRVYNQTYTNFSGDMTPVIKRVIGENIATLEAQPLKGTNLNFSRYFLDDNKHMPREFSIAITLGIVDHLLNFDPQRASLRTSEDIAKMFRLDFDTEKGGKGERVPLNIEQRYKSLGVLKTTMLTELGKNVWKYLEMREIRQDDFKANFENYFGNLALDALEQIGVLEKDTTSVTMQQFAQDKAEIINHNKSRDQSPQEADEDIKGYQTFYKLKTVKPDGKVYNAEVANREAGTSQLAKIYGYIPINQFEVQEFIASIEAKKVEELKKFPSKVVPGTGQDPAALKAKRKEIAAVSKYVLF